VDKEQLKIKEGQEETQESRKTESYQQEKEYSGEMIFKKMNGERPECLQENKRKLPTDKMKESQQKKRGGEIDKPEGGGRMFR